MMVVNLSLQENRCSAMPVQLLYTMTARVSGQLPLDEPEDLAPNITTRFCTPLGAAFLAAERENSRELVVAMRGLPVEDHDAVLKNIVVRALAQSGDRTPLLAMTMLLPQRAELHVSMGFAYLLREFYAAAHRSFRYALALKADATLALLGCGVALQNLGQPALAAEFLNRVLRQDKDGQSGRAAVVALLRLLGDSDVPTSSRSAPADEEPIPYVPGTANDIITY